MLSFNYKNIINIPNILSLLRILILPLIAHIIKNDTNISIFTGLFLLFFIATDFFDGFIARKYNIVTKLGKILDPLADKISIITLSYLIVYYRNFPLWAFYIIVGREILIVIGALSLLKLKNIIPQSNIFGKLATASISSSIIAYILKYKIGYTLLLIGIFFYIIAFISYIIKFIKLSHSLNI